MRSPPAVLLCLVLLAAPLVGCIGSEGEDIDATDVNDTPSEEAAPSPLPEQITGIGEVGIVETDGAGNGIWIDEDRDLLLSSNAGGGLQLFDIADPANVQKMGSLGDIYARDADILSWNGTPYAILAGGGEGIHVVDISDPSDPELVVSADAYASHNVASIPGTPYVYDATAVGAQQKVSNPIVPVLDLTDPEEPSWSTIDIPAVVNGQPTQSDGCHDVVVRPDLAKAFCAGGGSMYAAGGGETFIWDISEDVTDPVWEGIIDNPSIMYHHQAVASEDGELLFINDEFIAPNCNGAGTPVVDAKQSTAAMWIYDISDPASPEMRSYVQVPSEEVPANCGSHFGDLVDDRDVVVWGWYEGGTLLVDVSDPDAPEITDRHVPTSGQTWDARYHEGHVYGSSGNLEVLELLGDEGPEA